MTLHAVYSNKNQHVYNVMYICIMITVQVNIQRALIALSIR